MTTALSVYGGSTADSTLATAAPAFTGTGGTQATNSTTIAAGVLHYGQVYAIGTTNAWLSHSGAITDSACNPDGNGWLLDSTVLEGQTIEAGNWTPSFHFSTGTVGGSITADIYIRAFKRSSGGTYTLIGSMLKSAVTIAGQTQTAVTWSATSLGAVSFGTGDKLYYDCWWNVTANTGTPQKIKTQESVSTSQGLAAAAQIDTPGYVATTNALGGPTRGVYYTQISPLKEQPRSTYKTSMAIKGRSRSTYKTAMYLVEKPRGKFYTQTTFKTQPRETYKTASVLSSATRSKFITRFLLADLSRTTYKTASVLKAVVRDTFKAAMHVVGRSRETYLTKAGIKLPSRGKFNTQITGMKNVSRGKFNTRFTLIKVAREKFYNASILAARTRETFYTAAKLAFPSRDKFTTLAGLKAVAREKFTTAIHFASQPRTTYKTKFNLNPKNRAAFSIRFPLAENTRGRFSTQITGMKNTTRSQYIIAISLIGRVRETFKVLDIAGLKNLGASLRDKFYTAAVLQLHPRGKFYTRFTLVITDRSKFYNAMLLKFGDRAKYYTRFQISEATRNKFYTRFTGGTAAWEKFYTRAVLRFNIRSKFYNRAVLAFTGRTKEYIAAHLQSSPRSKFSTRFGLVGRTRDLYYTKVMYLLQTRSKAFTSVVTKIGTRSTFSNRAFLSSSARSKFRTLTVLKTQLQQTFSTRFHAGFPTRASFSKSTRLQGNITTAFITAYSLIARLWELYIFKSTRRTFRVRFADTIDRYSASFREVYVAQPFSTVFSDATVIDNNNLLQNNLSSVSVLVYFPDGTTATYALNTGVANMGNGVYQLNYITRGVGMNREVWTFTAGDGSALTAYNSVPVTY